MRISWKEVAFNLVVHMNRDQMVAAYDSCIKRIKDDADKKSDFELDGLMQTARYLAECILDDDLS